MSFDANSNVTRLTMPNGSAHDFGYDPMDREELYTAPPVGGPPTVTATDFDRDGLVSAQTHPGPVEVRIDRDTAGRVIGVRRPSIPGDSSSAVELSYRYDGGLLRAESSTGEVEGEVGFRYDNEFWLRELTVSTPTDPETSTLYDYDLDGLLTRMTADGVAMSVGRDPANGRLTGTEVGNIRDSHSYNGFGEPSAYQAEIGAQTAFAQQFERDDLGRITRKTETILGTTTTYDYRYDDASRLDTVTRDGALIADYDHDLNGNRTRVIGTNLPDPAGGFGATSLTGTYDAQDRQLSYGACTYNHTANGERTTKTCGAQVTTHHYDVHGNLTRVERTGAPTIDYLIDGRGRRVGKQVDGQWVERFLYAGQLEPVAKLDDQGRVIERYHYAERGQTPSLIVKHDGATPQAYRVIADHLGSVRLVVRLSDGQVVQRLDYDAFGAITLDTNPGFQPFGFVGGLQDRDTGLVRFGARDYDPATGRWVSKEPLGFGGALNWYEYAGGDPVNWVDLDGRTGYRVDSVIRGEIDNFFRQFSSPPEVEVGAGLEGTLFATGGLQGGFGASLNSKNGICFLSEVCFMGGLGAAASTDIVGFLQVGPNSEHYYAGEVSGGLGSHFSGALGASPEGFCQLELAGGLGAGGYWAGKSCFVSTKCYGFD